MHACSHGYPHGIFSQDYPKVRVLYEYMKWGSQGTAMNTCNVVCAQDRVLYTCSELCTPGTVL